MPRKYTERDLYSNSFENQPSSHCRDSEINNLTHLAAQEGGEQKVKKTVQLF